MLRTHRITRSSVRWRTFVSVLIKQAHQRLNARLAVVGRNPHARTQTSRVLRNTFVPKKDRAASTWPPVRLPLNSISVADQSFVLRRKISVVWIMLLYYMFIWPFLNARKSVGGIPATPIILRQCSTIKRWLYLHVATWWVDKFAEFCIEIPCPCWGNCLQIQGVTFCATPYRPHTLISTCGMVL